MARGGRLILVALSGLLVGLACNSSFLPETFTGTVNGYSRVDPFAVLPAWFLASVAPTVLHVSRGVSAWFLPSFVRLPDLTIFNIWTGHVILALNQHGV